MFDFQNITLIVNFNENADTYNAIGAFKHMYNKKEHRFISLKN